MNKLILAFFFSFLCITALAQEYPAKPGTLVNDYTNTLSASQKQQLEDKLKIFDDSTSNQIAIAIVKTVGEYDINEYALGLGRAWGVGSGKKNNGVMIVVALGDRKISIQTGYGLEGALPDVITKRIIENEIKPSFKGGDYYGGLDAGTTAIIKYTKGEYKNDSPKASKKGGGSGSIAIIIIIIVIIVLIIKKGGGGGSGGSRVLGSRGGVGEALLWGALFGSGGRSSGSSWGGASSGGGGFGGFGGGSFGGGGSSGSW